MPVDEVRFAGPLSKMILHYSREVYHIELPEHRFADICIEIQDCFASKPRMSDEQKEQFISGYVAGFRRGHRTPQY